MNDIGFRGKKDFRDSTIQNSFRKERDSTPGAQWRTQNVSINYVSNDGQKQNKKKKKLFMKVPLIPIQNIGENTSHATSMFNNVAPKNSDRKGVQTAGVKNIKSRNHYIQSAAMSLEDSANWDTNY